MGSPLMAKLAKISKNHDNSGCLTNSKYLERGKTVTFDVPALNIASSGTLKGGLSAGVTMIVGESRTYKSRICLYIVGEYLREHPNSVCIFVNGEFGVKGDDWAAFGIDTDRVHELAVGTVEEMKIKVNQILDGLSEEDEAIWFIDSVSVLASRKEVDDAIKGEEKADMTRAKALNSYWRTVTSTLVMYDMPMLAINSFYEDIGNKYAEKNIKGGKQGFLSADTIWFVSRRNYKAKTTDTHISGFDFVYTILKSRYVKEKSKIPINVTFDMGIDKYSGLLEIAQAGGFVEQVNNKYYTRKKVDDDKKWLKKQTSCPEFWDVVLNDSEFEEFVAHSYRLDSKSTAILELCDEDGVVIDE